MVRLHWPRSIVALLDREPICIVCCLLDLRSATDGHVSVFSSQSLAPIYRLQQVSLLGMTASDPSHYLQHQGAMVTSRRNSEDVKYEASFTPISQSGSGASDHALRSLLGGCNSVWVLMAFLPCFAMSRPLRQPIFAGVIGRNVGTGAYSTGSCEKSALQRAGYAQGSRLDGGFGSFRDNEEGEISPTSRSRTDRL